MRTSLSYSEKAMVGGRERVGERSERAAPPVIEVETNQEYWDVDFAITDSNFKFANYVDETVKVYFLGGLGMLRGIYPSF
jgi:hypothetical protein